MREDFLQYVWKYKRFSATNMRTGDGEQVQFYKMGYHNDLAGPDFVNAQAAIGDQLWVGNVEVHINASDWYVHRHEKDANYNNVILHVVWNHDVDVYRKDGSIVPCIELKNRIDQSTYENFQDLLGREPMLFHCEKKYNKVNRFIRDHWLERMFFERFEHKSERILEMVQATQNDWESVMYHFLLRAFGLNINNQSFDAIGKHIQKRRVQQMSLLQLEAMLYGLGGMLDISPIDFYTKELQREYAYLKRKYQLDESVVPKAQFFKLRPPNFPTIRLSQYANLIKNTPNLFTQLMSADDPEEFYSLLRTSSSKYWNEHFNFGKSSAKSTIKTTTKSFIDLLLINVILPFRFCYDKAQGKFSHKWMLQIVQQIKPENNSLIKKVKQLDISVDSAMESQGYLQLYKQYCVQKRCLQCVIGVQVLKD
ncbi:MAG: DUF2851 family protein [Flavobacteriaceae bacterium]|nr:DUF2851 family protein [Flavobacteriaceae bacterium]